MWSVSGRAGLWAVSPFQGQRLALLSGPLRTIPVGPWARESLGLAEKRAGGHVAAQSGAPELWKPQELGLCPTGSGI